MQKKNFGLACVLALSLVSCASNPPPLENTSGFLPNYSVLKPVSSPEGSQIYTYTAPDVERSDYHALIVAPVILYQNAASHGVTNQQIATARANIDSGIKQVASQHIALTQTAGPGVAVLQVAITGATASADGFKPWNVIPISAAIKLATMATDTDSKTPVLVIELKFTDSVTGKLLREDVTVISGETFRNRANTPEEFQQLAQTWVKEALKYANENSDN
jgi:hypothetical protein